MKRHFILTIFFVSVVVFFNQCNIFENNTTSGSILVIEYITGTDLEGTTGSTTVFCDVISSTGSIVNDTGTALLFATLIDPFFLADNSYYQDIIVDQVDIEYSRVDGKNQEGVDVPFRFSQKVALTIPIDTDSELSFVLVQHTAKLESPLVDLANYGQEKILKLEARVTFHGHDVGGHRIQPVTGTISVWCANFAD